MDLISSSTSLQCSPVPAIKALPATAPVQIPRFEVYINHCKFHLTSVVQYSICYHTHTHTYCMLMSMFVPFWPVSHSRTTKKYGYANHEFIWPRMTNHDDKNVFVAFVPKKIPMSRHQCWAGHSPNQWQRRTSLKPSCKETGSIGCMIGQFHWCFPRLLHYCIWIFSNNTSASSTTGLWAEEPTEAQGA